jgi:hypothetical protein
MGYGDFPQICAKLEAGIFPGEGLFIRMPPQARRPPP